MTRKMPVTTANMKKLNKTSEFVSNIENPDEFVSNIENPESHEEVRDFLALCPFAIFKLKVGIQ